MSQMYARAIFLAICLTVFLFKFRLQTFTIIVYEKISVRLELMILESSIPLTFYKRPSQKSIAGNRLSLDNYCVTISLRTSANKVSLERALHDLNADSFVLEISQEIMLLQPYEVT